MLTVKIIQDGVTVVYETDKFFVHQEGSEQFEFAKNLLQKEELTPAGVTALYHTQALYTDSQCTSVLKQEEVLYTSRSTTSAGIMTGVVVTSNEDFESNPEEEYETEYLILTTEDRVYVTNDVGKTVFSL